MIKLWKFIMFNLMLHSNNFICCSELTVESNWLAGWLVSRLRAGCWMHPISKFEIRAAPSKHRGEETPRSCVYQIAACLAVFLETERVSIKPH